METYGMESKKTFILKSSWIEVFSQLSDKQAGKLIKSLYSYNVNGDLPAQLDDMEVKAYFNMMKLECDEFLKNYDKSKYHDPPQGENHWNWKGGITDENHRQRESSDYKRWRMDVFCRDNYTCQHCKQIGGVLNAHHIKPFSVYPELRFDIENGLTLCRRCHIEIHRKEREWQETVS